MTYVLDTDVLTICELPDSPAYARLHARLHARVLHLADDDRIATTIVTDEEQTRGWLAYMAKSRDVRHPVRAYDRLKRHLLTYATLDVLDFDAADVFAGLVRRKLGVGSSDLKIAAIALARRAVLPSRNLKDFRKVPGLTVDDWTGE